LNWGEKKGGAKFSKLGGKSKPALEVILVGPPPLFRDKTNTPAIKR